MRKSEQMTCVLFTLTGERKYLTDTECEAFIVAATAHERGEVRTFGLVLAYTGARISEALELTPRRIDTSSKSITFRTLKQRRENVYRTVPVPDRLLDDLELVHRIRKALRGRKGQGDKLLWSWGRTQGYKHIKALMDEVGIKGSHASPKGLRHGFGEKAASKTRQPSKKKKWLGHRDLNTTAVYMDVQGEEERELAARLWE